MKLILISLIMLGLLGCGYSSDDTYQYEFLTSFNGNECSTGFHEFESMENYCRALTDEILNNACAREMRKNQYKEECGKDFEPTNIDFQFEVWGYDSILKKSCSVVIDKVFARHTDICDELKNERLHDSCHWEARNKRFNEEACYNRGNGQFSEKPKAPVVSPSPEPNPEPNPSPEEPVPSLPPTLREIKDLGIEVQIFRGHEHEIGKRPFQERLIKFDSHLKRFVKYFKNNKGLIKQLVISNFTTMKIDPNNGSRIVLDVDLPLDNLELFLQGFKERALFLSISKIKYDFGIEFYSLNRDENIKEREHFNRLTKFLSNHRDELFKFNNLFDEIEFNQDYHFNFLGRSLKFTRDYANEFDLLEEGLSLISDGNYKIRSIFNSININYENVDTEKEFEELAEINMFIINKLNTVDFRKLKINFLKSIDFKAINSDYPYLFSDRLIIYSPMNSQSLDKLFDILRVIHILEENYKIKTTKGIQVTDEFTLALEKAYQLKDELKYIGIDNIHHIKSGKSKRLYNTLYINHNDSLSQIRSILKI